MVNFMTQTKDKISNDLFSAFCFSYKLSPSKIQFFKLLNDIPVVKQTLQQDDVWSIIYKYISMYSKNQQILKLFFDFIKDNLHNKNIDFYSFFKHESTRLEFNEEQIALFLCTILDIDNHGHLPLFDLLLLDNPKFEEWGAVWNNIYEVLFIHHEDTIHANKLSRIISWKHKNITPIFDEINKINKVNELHSENYNTSGYLHINIEKLVPSISSNLDTKIVFHSTALDYKLNKEMLISFFYNFNKLNLNNELLSDKFELILFKELILQDLLSGIVSVDDNVSFGFDLALLLEQLMFTENCTKKYLSKVSLYNPLIRKEDRNNIPHNNIPLNRLIDETNIEHTTPKKVFHNNKEIALQPIPTVMLNNIKNRIPLLIYNGMENKERFKSYLHDIILFILATPCRYDDLHDSRSMMNKFMIEILFFLNSVSMGDIYQSHNCDSANLTSQSIPMV